MTTPPFQPWNQPPSNGSVPGQNPGGPSDPAQGSNPGLWSNPATGSQPGQYNTPAGQYGAPSTGQYGAQPGLYSPQSGPQSTQSGQYGSQSSPYSAQSGPYNPETGQYGAQPGQVSQQPGQYGQQPGQYGAQPAQVSQQPGQYGQQPGQYSTPGQYNAQQSQFGQPSASGQSTGWSTPTGPDGIGQSGATAPPGYYLASDGRYYPLVDQPAFGPQGPPQPEDAKPKRKKRGLLVAAAVVVALVVAGGGAWALLALRGGGGAASPEEAAESLLVDLASLDFSKVASRVAPSEQTLFDPVMEIADDSKNQTADQKKALEIWEDVRSSLTIKFDDLTFSSQSLADGVDRTAVTGGTVSLDADTDKLADAIMDLYDLSGDSAASMSQSLSMLMGVPNLDADLLTNRSDIKDKLDQFFPVSKALDDLVAMAQMDDLFVVTVKEDGKWFSSASMTLAQYAYEDAGLDNDALGDPIPDGEMKGASKPEEAVTNLVAALNATAETGDLRELAKALPVAESRLVAVYGTALAESSEIGSVSFLGAIDSASGTKNSEIGGHARITLDSLSMGGLLNLSRSGDTWTIEVFVGGAEVTVTLTQEGQTSWTAKARVTSDYSGESNISASLSVPSKGVVEADYSDGTSSGGFTYQGGCMTVETNGSENTICGDELGVDLTDAPINDIEKLPDLKDLLALSAVHGAGGDWYISLVGSLVDPAVLFADSVG
jgi:hypothetical protein